MSSTIPYGTVSCGQIREYIGLSDKVHFSRETTPLSLRQIFFSPHNSIALNTYPYFALSSMQGCKFAAYTNYSRSSVVGSSLTDLIQGDKTLYLGLSNPSQNYGRGQSGLLYTRNRGLPIKLDIRSTGINLDALNITTHSGTSNTYKTYYNIPSSFQITDNIHSVRFFVDQDRLGFYPISEFILRIIPMLDGKTEGSGEHVISMRLYYPYKDLSEISEEPPLFDDLR